MATEMICEANTPDLLLAGTKKQALGGRLRQVRTDRYGEDGGPVLAQLLDIPHRTWLNYENGVTIPGEVLLKVLVLTGVEPQWLLGGGAMYRA